MCVLVAARARRRLSAEVPEAETQAGNYPFRHDTLTHA